MDDDATRDIEAATRALEAELAGRDEARPLSEAELNRLVDYGTGLERALRRAQEAGLPIPPAADLVWQRARAFAHAHEPMRRFGRIPPWDDPPGAPGAPGAS